ncbi:MAG: iron chelate uptake ABC transporter family permease subunit [Deltaproteobacteria bacterium]|nr:iron chelate uptake ABC transporter family permease subunit [Deltaproteobacteria bacterium]
MDSHIIRRPLTPGRVLKVSSILGVSLAVTVIISLMLGTANVSLEDVLRMFFHGSQVKESARLIVLKIRLPRIFLAGFTGFSLSLGVMGIIFGVGFSIGVPLFSFCGALLTIYLVLTISRRKMGVESATAILAGVIVNAFFTAIIMFFIATSSEDRLHSMLFWLYGDLSQSQIAYSGIIAPVCSIPFQDI